jgi:flavin-binding protein dodecin
MDAFIEQGAVKVIELIGVSDESFEDAIKQAVARAAESITGITGVEVQSLNARVDDGQVVQFRATMKLAFAVR